MKHGITLLLLISCTTHTAPSGSRPQPVPLQYLYVTPTLVDNDSQDTIYTGKYSYIDLNDNTLKPAQKPPQPYDRYSVNIESANLSFNPDQRVQLPLSLKSILTIMYSIQKRTQSGIEVIQEAKMVTFDYLAQDGTSFERVLPHLSCTLRILADRISVFQKQ